MNHISLRLRLVLGGVIAILVALTVAGAGLSLIFERHVARTIGEELDVYLRQLLSGIDIDPQGALVIVRPPSDPRFAEPLSGLYWQVGDDRGQLLRSRSLWDTALPLATDDPAAGESHQHEISGPANARVLVREWVISLAAGDQRLLVRIAAAADLGRASAATAAFARDLGAALGLLAIVLVIATVIQVTLGLRPLDVLRRGIADIRTGRSHNLPSAVPTEVRPLVEDFNALLDAQEREIERSRGRAADLAHGLKTPLAALAADVARLQAKGEQEIARAIESVGEEMRRHVDRELARARARGSIRGRAERSTGLLPLVRSLIDTLARTPAGERVNFETRIAAGAEIPIDRTDLAEILGNLLDNAARHAAALVRVSADREVSALRIMVEDDGKGIAPPERSRVLERGARLDEREAEGPGLGLAIVQDLLEAYGWHLQLGTSDLGGLKATVAGNVADTSIPGGAAGRQSDRST